MKWVLDNGLTVVLKEEHAAPITAIRIFVKTGSATEGKYMGTGISHFLEHLIGEGTKTRKKEELEKLEEMIGGASNAYTTYDHTCYYMVSPKEYFDVMLDLISDNYLNSTLPDKAFSTQKGVILNEINMGMDEPERYISQKFMETIYQINPLRNPVIGHRDLFMNLDRDDILDYYADKYNPDNTVVVASGDFDTAETLEKIKAAFKNFKKTSYQEPYIPTEPEQISKRSETFAKDISLTYLKMGYHIVQITHEDTYTLDVISTVLGEGLSSRLYQEIKENLGLCFAIETSSYIPRFSKGLFLISSVNLPENTEAVENAILKEISKLAKEYVSPEELARVKNMIKSNHVLSNQTVQDQASKLGMDEIYTGDIHFNEKYLEKIDKITKEDIMKVTQKYFKDNNLTVVSLNPLKYSKDQIMLKSKKESLKKAIKLQKLPNGIKLLTLENNTLPLVTLNAFFVGGVITENEENNGISNLMTTLLLKGTKKRDAKKIAEEIEGYGAIISTNSERNSFSVSITILKEHFDAALDVMSDVIKNSTFSQEQIKKEKEVVLAAIKHRDDDWQAYANHLLLSLLFKESPYKFDILGSPETINSLKREDILGYYKTYCRPNNMVLAIFGDIKEGDVTKKVSTYFADFKAGGELPLDLKKENKIRKNREQIKYLDREQAVINIGFHGLKIDDEQRYAFFLADAILTGVGYPGGRLHKRLRGNELVYL
ncbi:insulinase family protein, partial [bacterium]|nr:insulinase family protein [bacterium]